MCVTSFIQLKGTDRLCKVIKLSMQWTNSWGFIWDIPYIAGLFLLWTLIAPLIWDIPYIAGLFLLWTLIAPLIWDIPYIAGLFLLWTLIAPLIWDIHVYILDILNFFILKSSPIKGLKRDQSHLQLFYFLLLLLFEKTPSRVLSVILINLWFYLKDSLINAVIFWRTVA